MNSLWVSTVIISIAVIDMLESRTVYNKFDELPQPHYRNNENLSRGRIRAFEDAIKPIPVVNYENVHTPKVIQPSITLQESTFVPIIDKYGPKLSPQHIVQNPLKGQQPDEKYAHEREHERKRKPKIKEIHVHEHQNIALHYHKLKPMEHYIVPDHNYEYSSITRKPNQSVNQNYDEPLDNLQSHNNYNTNDKPKRANSLDGPTKLSKYKEKPNSYNNLGETVYDQIPQNTYSQDINPEYGKRIPKKPQKYYNSNTNHTSSSHHDGISNDQIIPERSSALTQRPTSSSTSSSDQPREKPNRYYHKHYSPQKYNMTSYHEEIATNDQTIPQRPAASKQKPASSSNNHAREKPYNYYHTQYPAQNYETTSSSRVIPERPAVSIQKFTSSSNNHARAKPYHYQHHDYTAHDRPRDEIFSINIQHPNHPRNLPTNYDVDIQDYPREQKYNVMEHTHTPQKYHHHKQLPRNPYRVDKEDYTVRVIYSSD